MNESSSLPPQMPSSSSSVSQPTDPQHLMRFEAGKKSTGLAFVLCWLFGALGAHRFYLGRPHAVTMLIITIVSVPLCFVIIGFFGLLGVWIWVIVDLFSVSRWVKDYNMALLARLASGQPG